MRRSRLALLLLLAGVLTLLAGWWLLRALRPLPAPPVPTPPLPTPPVASPREAVELLRHAIEPLRRGGVTRVPYRAPSSEELESYRRWVDDQLRVVAQGSAPELPPPAGFRTVPVADWGKLLAEELDSRRGAGVLVLRTGAAQPLLIEVPHSFYDQGTLDVGLYAFVASGARALLVNTVHRHRSLGEPAVEPLPGGIFAASDVAHAETSFFLSAHAACVDAWEPLQVMQLHGFADAAAPGTDAILSAAGSRADPEPVARALERTLGIRAAVYPTQVKVLGGTKNQEAHYSIAAGRPFLHVELSASLLEQLQTDSDRLALFSKGLFGGSP
jgi:hypothetical protein